MTDETSDVVSEWSGGELPVDTTDQDYRKAPGFNQSTANELLSRSPMHAFEKRRKQDRLANKPEPDNDHSREREMGTVIHKLLLGSTVGFFEIHQNDYRTKIAQSTRRECELSGITPILAVDLERCRMSANRATEQLREVLGIELDGESEVPLYWQETIATQGGLERVNGAKLDCKAKLDHIRKDGLTILDIKSGEDANPQKLMRRILDAGYHVQAAAYTRALVANRPKALGRTTYIDVFVETSGLVMCTAVAITGSLYELGQRRWQRACRVWWESQQAAQYDGYAAKILAPEAPAWALEQEMEND